MKKMRKEHRTGRAMRTGYRCLWPMPMAIMLHGAYRGTHPDILLHNVARCSNHDAMSEGEDNVVETRVVSEPATTLIRR